MKRFEVVIDLSKQLISLATALIGGSIVISPWFFEFMNETVVFVSFIIALISWALSIAFGVFNIGATVNLIETQEKNNKSIEIEDKFVSVFDSTVGPSFGMLQQAFFGIGVLFFAFAFLGDKIH